MCPNHLRSWHLISARIRCVFPGLFPVCTSNHCMCNTSKAPPIGYCLDVCKYRMIFLSRLISSCTIEKDAYKACNHQPHHKSNEPHKHPSCKVLKSTVLSCIDTLQFLRDTRSRTVQPPRSLDPSRPDSAISQPPCGFYCRDSLLYTAGAKRLSCDYLVISNDFHKIARIGRMLVPEFVQSITMAVQAVAVISAMAINCL